MLPSYLFDRLKAHQVAGKQANKFQFSKEKEKKHAKLEGDPNGVPPSKLQVRQLRK